MKLVIANLKMNLLFSDIKKYKSKLEAADLKDITSLPSLDKLLLSLCPISAYLTPKLFSCLKDDLPVNAPLSLSYPFWEHIFILESEK